MRVLWLTTVTPEFVCKAMGRKRNITGGWIDGMYNSIRHNNASAGGDIELSVVCSADVETPQELMAENVRCYLTPMNWQLKYDETVKSYFREVQRKENPDVVHVHGSEYPMGLNWIDANGHYNVMVSLQGIISVIEKYYMAGIEGVSSYTTLRDVLRSDSMSRQRQKFAQRGEYEKRLLARVPFVAGRTEWDFAHVRSLNQYVRYFHVGEALRAPFLESRKWKYADCVPHTIFMSQGYYPIKGTHKAIEALAIVVKEFPDAILNVAGENPVDKPFYRLGGYGKYLKTLISGYNLGSNVRFLGNLDAAGMIKQYLDSNLFLLPSAIENSPNSLAEAIHLGVPRLASFCGGTPQMLNWNGDELYRYEEVEELAMKIIRVFRRGSDVTPSCHCGLSFSNNDNFRDLLNAYKAISQTP